MTVNTSELATPTMDWPWVVLWSASVFSRAAVESEGLYRARRFPSEGEAHEFAAARHQDGHRAYVTREYGW